MADVAVRDEGFDAAPPPTGGRFPPSFREAVGLPRVAEAAPAGG